MERSVTPSTSRNPSKRPRQHSPERKVKIVTHIKRAHRNKDGYFTALDDDVSPLSSSEEGETF